MENKTIANWLIGSFALCVLGTFMVQGGEFQGLVFMLGGAGLIAFGIVATLRLNKLRGEWSLQTIGLLASIILLFVSVYSQESGVQLASALSVWGFGIWEIVSLYKWKEVKLPIDPVEVQ